MSTTNEANSGVTGVAVVSSLTVFAYSMFSVCFQYVFIHGGAVLFHISQRVSTTHMIYFLFLDMFWILRARQ